MLLVAEFSKKYMSLSLKLCKVSLPLGMFMIVPFHFHPQLELGLFLAGIVLDIVAYVSVQILGIELSNLVINAQSDQFHIIIKIQSLFD